MSLTKDSHRDRARQPGGANAGPSTLMSSTRDLMERTIPRLRYHGVVFRGNDRKLLPLGSKAPEFRLPDETGREIALADFRGRSGVVLVFYVMDATPG